MSGQTAPQRRLRKDTFIESLRIQGRVIGALFLREIITRYGRHGLGFLWLFLEPMMFSVGITILWTVGGMAHSQGNSMSVAGFALTGYSSIVLWRNMINRLSNNTSANKGLLYHPNVRVVDLIYARALLEFAACTMSLGLLSVVFWGLGLMDLPADPLKVALAWALYAWFVIAVGMVAAFMGESSEIFDRVLHIMVYLSLPFTGAFSMISWLPSAMQSTLLYSPLIHGVEMLREGYFGEGITANYSVAYLFQANLIATLFGLILIRNIRRNLIDG
jgi:capsular polysaccharide transport system permease protein